MWWNGVGEMCECVVDKNCMRWGVGDDEEGGERHTQIE